MVGAHQANENCTDKKTSVASGNTVSNEKIKMLLLNAISIVNISKRFELEAYAKLNGYKIIAVTESWATPEMSDAELGLEGFVLFCKDRRLVRDGRGGGVLLYVRNDLKCVALDNLNELNCESVWMELSEKFGIKNYHWCMLQESVGSRL